MEFFDKVYPFTTESISGYMKHMDVKDKSVLTVGSSMDQALNACLYGAKDITVMDISKTTKDYMLYKLYLILNTHSTDELYKAICNTRDYKLSREELFGLDALRKMSPYLESEETYNRLKENIMKSTFQFIHGDIFKMDQAVGNKKYDRIILSNVLQYIEVYRGDIPVDVFIKNNFEVFRKHLNEEGILQLLYIYNYCKNNHFLGFTTIDLLNALSEYELELAKFKSGQDTDAAIIYTKK